MFKQEKKKKIQKMIHLVPQLLTSRVVPYHPPSQEAALPVLVVKVIYSQFNEDLTLISLFLVQMLLSRAHFSTLPKKVTGVAKWERTNSLRQNAVSWSSSARDTPSPLVAVTEPQK